MRGVELMKPQKVLHDYIKRNHSGDLKNLGDCNRQSKLNLDYTLFNDYFKQESGFNFFDISNHKKILSDVEHEINEHNSAKNWITIKIVDVPPNCLLHDLDASYAGDVVSAKAMIKNITEPYPSLKTAVYECRSCMRTIRMDIHDNILTEPTLCPDCGGRSFRLNQELSEYRNYRYVKLEEPLELRSGGQTREIKAYMQDYLASPFHTLKAGDVCDIIGTFQIRKTEKSNKKNDFEFIIDLHNICPVDNAFEDYRINDEDKQEIINLSQEPMIYNRLVASLAPDIYSYDTVKEGLLLQLFEGYRPEDDVFKNDYMDRWTSHILLIGDPGIGKSQLITALSRKAPKIITINGADTSKAGLTTSAVKDELTGAWTLEAGAVVLADTGVLCIDEFDKLGKSSQKGLNQAMEQLSVSSAKAGLVQTMSARTSIIACANPKYGRFNPYKSVREQINIPDSTLSRFDLVFALEDVIDKENDTKLADNLLNKNLESSGFDLIDEELFKKYVTYAKMECYPVLDKEAKDLLIKFYVETRQTAKQDNHSKPITARDLKALERLTIARAKTELREKANANDAECSIRIYREALKTLGLEPENVGELHSVMSPIEMRVVNDSETMIIDRMIEYGLRDLNDLLLTDVKREIRLLCYELNLNNDKIMRMVYDNVSEKLKL